MSWRVHTARIDHAEVSVQSLGWMNRHVGLELTEDDDRSEVALVITDPGNQEAWVLRGQPVSRSLFARRLKRALGSGR